MKSGCLALVVLAACAAPATSTSPVASTPAVGDDAVLATVAQQPITRASLGKQADEAVRDIDNELAQRRLHLLWLGVEERIDEIVLAQEAQRRGVSVDKLVKDEIEAFLQSPTDAQLRAVYDDNKERIQVAFEVAAPILREQMTERQRQELRDAFLARLRQDVEVTYNLPVPELPRYDVNDGGAPSKGAKNAKVTVVEFSDFQCPYCEEARTLMSTLLARYPDELRVVYRDFPLDQHPEARQAAEAAQCAHEQEQFWPYHDLLFDNPDKLESNALKQYAQELDLNMEAFNACLASGRSKSIIAQHEKAAEKLGVQGTPAIFLNGIKLIGLLPLPLMQALVDHELAGGKT